MLGRSLALHARRLAAQRLPALPWLAALQPVIGRITALPIPAGERFRRKPTPGSFAAPRPPDRVDRPSWDEPDGEPVPAGLRTKLREVVGPGADVVRLHTGAHAAAVAGAAGADALNVGRHVFLRRGRIRGDDEDFALLSHETEHVLRGMRPGAAWRRATQSGVAEEEQAALNRERSARSYVRGDLAPGPTSVPFRAAEAVPFRAAEDVPFRTAESVATPRAYPQAPEAVSRSMPLAGTTSAAMRPMAASTDRNTSVAPTSAPPTTDFEAMKRAVHRDLLGRIRSDFERGG